MGIPYDVTFHPQWWHKNAGVAFNRQFFFDPDYRLEADIKMRKILHDKFGDFGLGEKNPAPRPILGSDLIASGFLHSEILGCQVRYSDDNPPEVICANLDDEAIKALQVPDLAKSELWQKIAGQIAYLQNKFGYCITCINLMGIQNIAMDLRGQNLFMDYYMKPELAAHLLAVCTETSIEIGQKLNKASRSLSAGVTAIVKQTAPTAYVTSNCSVEMVSLDTYNQFLLQYDNLLAGNFQPFGIHHCGQTMEHVVDGYAMVKNLEFAEVGAFSNIKYVREKLPGIHLNARYSPVKLAKVGLNELREDISQIIRAAKPVELLSISCVGIDSTVSDQQIRNFLQCCVDC